MDEYEEQAEQLVTLIRSQNWKNGGVMTVDNPDAVAVISQALRTAHSAGAVEAATKAGENIMRAFDAAVR